MSDPGLFIKGIAGWNSSLGQDFLSSRDGHDDSGCLEGTSEFTFTEELNLYQCAEFAGAQYGTYGAGAWVKVISGTQKDLWALPLGRENRA